MWINRYRVECHANYNLVFCFKRTQRPKKEKLDLPADMFQCNQCRYKAKQSGTLSRHIKSVHEGAKFPCPHCDHTATQKGNLVTHIKSIHEGVKFPCARCDFKATQKSNLLTHIKSFHED